jgi:hypothetical protein
VLLLKMNIETFPITQAQCNSYHLCLQLYLWRLQAVLLLLLTPL